MALWHPDAKQVRLAANEQVAVRHRKRSVNLFTNGILPHEFVLGAGSQHEGIQPFCLARQQE